MSVKTTAFLILAILAAGASLFGDQISVTWNGGSGDWTDPTEWSGNIVPSNGADTYLATINSGSVDTVNLFNRNIFIDGLTTGSRATVNVNDQGLQLGNALSTKALLTNAGTLNFTNAGSLTLDFSGGASASNSGAINLGDEAEIFLNATAGGSGVLNNTGNISLQSNPHGSQIYLTGDGATFTLNGGGNLTLSDNAANLITGTFGTESLVSDNKFSGAGTISNLTNFTNNGTVTANGTNPLIFNLDYSTGGTNLTGMITNNGSIKVANGGTLTLQGGNGDFSVMNSGTISLNSTNFITQLVYNDNGNHHALFLSGAGTLNLSDSSGNLVLGANGDETLFNQLHHTITGTGLIAGFGGGIVNNGTIIANGVNPLTFGINDATANGKPGITNAGLIQVNDGGTLQILSTNGGTILNAGSITLNANTSTSTLSFNDLKSGGTSGPPGTVLQIAGGALTLSDNPGNRITGVSGDEGFQINAGTTLSGAGTISNFGGYEGLTNVGTILVNGHNPLILDGTATTAAISTPLTLCGCIFSALSNFGLVQVNDGSTFEIRSALGASIHNWSGFAGPGGGVITLNAQTSTSTLSFNSLGHTAFFTFDDNGPTTPGVLNLSDNPGNRIVGVSGFEEVLNGSYHTIQGAGTINLPFLLNQGTIVANGSNPLIFESPTKLLASLNNQGLIQVNDGSTFEIRSSQPGQTSILNAGSITLNAATSTSTLSFNSLGTPGVTFLLNGSGGTLTMTDNPGNRIMGVSGNEFLSNAGGTIQGAGTISNFGGGFDNSGTIIASGTNPLIVDITAATNAGNTGLSNSGTLQVNDGSTLQIRSGVGGTVVNGGLISLNSSAGTSTLSFNDLGKGQTFTLNGSGSVILSNGAGNRIVGVNGDETLINGTNSTIDGRGVISNFAQFTNNGTLSADKVTLEVQSPLGNWNPATRTLTGGTYNAFNGGSISLDSIGTNTITNLNGVAINEFSGGTVTGNGTVNMLSGLATVRNSQVTLDSIPQPLTITPNGAPSLTLTNSLLAIVSFTRATTITLNGDYSQDANSIFDLGAVSGPATPTPRSIFNVNGNFTNQGVANIGDAVGPATLRISGTLNNSNSFDIGPGANGVGASDFVNSGMFTIEGGSSAVITNGTTNSGTVDVLNGGVLLDFGDYVQTAGLTKVLTGGVLEAVNVDLEGGSLGGGGTIIGNVNVTGGTLAPGDPTTTNISGDFTLEAGGSLLFQIDGPGTGQFDSLDINGNLHLLGGTLDIIFGNGFLPQAGDAWDLLHFTGTEDGTGFGRIEFQNAGDAQFAFLFNGQNFELAEQPGSQAAPEPSTFLMIWLAALAGIAFRKLYSLLPGDPRELIR